MFNNRRKKEWAVVLFGLFLFVFMPPFLKAYDLSATVLGVPLSYFVSFVLWGLLIVAVALSTRWRSGVEGGEDDDVPRDSGMDEGAS